MIGFLFALALHSKSRKMEGRVNLRYVQVVYTLLPGSNFIIVEVDYMRAYFDTKKANYCFFLLF